MSHRALWLTLEGGDSLPADHESEDSHGVWEGKCRGKTLLLIVNSPTSKSLLLSQPECSVRGQCGIVTFPFSILSLQDTESELGMGLELLVIITSLHAASMGSN